MTSPGHGCRCRARAGSVRGCRGGFEPAVRTDSSFPDHGERKGLDVPRAARRRCRRRYRSWKGEGVQTQALGDRPLTRRQVIPRTSGRTAVDAPGRDVGAILLVRDAGHPRLLHHRHLGEWRPRAAGQCRSGGDGLLWRCGAAHDDSRRHLRRPDPRAVGLHPVGRSHHHDRSRHLGDTSGGDVVDRPCLHRHRYRFHQAESVDGRRWPL